MPVEARSKAQIAYQDELWLGPIEGGTIVTEWTQVLGFESLSQPSKVPEDIDVTHMQSPGRSRESIPGLLPVGELSQEMQHWDDDPGQMLLNDLAALNEIGTREDVLIEMVVGGVRRTYRANVSSFSIGGTVGAKRMATLDAKMFERQPTNERPGTP